MAKYPVDYAARLARAIGGASRALASEDAEQGPAWRELLSTERAWPLAVLLAFWYLQRAASQSPFRAAIRSLADESRASTPAADFYGVWRSFDAYAELLSQPAQLAYEAKTPNEVAAAGGAFKYAAKKIGVSLLSAALKSSLFVAVAERLRQVVPAPGSESAAQSPGSKPSERPAQGLLPKPGERTAQAMASSARPGTNRTPTTAAVRPALAVAPDLTEQDRCVLLLVSRGHSQKEAEQICQGPARQASRLPSAAKGKKA